MSKALSEDLGTATRCFRSLTVAERAAAAEIRTETVKSFIASDFSVWTDEFISWTVFLVGGKWLSIDFHASIITTYMVRNVYCVCLQKMHSMNNRQDRKEQCLVFAKNPESNYPLLAEFKFRAAKILKEPQLQKRISFFVLWFAKVIVKMWERMQSRE